MTRDELTQATGVKRIYTVTKTTTVVEYANGYVRPATPLEKRLWQLLKGGCVA